MEDEELDELDELPSLSDDVPLLDEELLALFFYFFLGADGLTALTGGLPLDFPMALVIGFLTSAPPPLFFFLSSPDEDDDELLDDSTLRGFCLLFLSDSPLLDEFFLPLPLLPPCLLGLPPPLPPPPPPLFALDELELLEDLLLELLERPLPAPSVIGC